MTTHDQRTEAIPSSVADEVRAAAVRAEGRTAQADSSTTAEPSTTQTEATDSAGLPSAVATDAVTNQTPASATHSEPPTADSESANAGTVAPAGMPEGSTAQAESPTETSLFSDDELAGHRARWDNVQAGFVDDPKECVHKADGLVSDVVDQLTAGFAETRSRLEEQWDRGEQVSTEALRVALRRYRDFFERLLAV
ncbi:MAG: hypothetical protein QOH91_1336 [Mycobacterium sp.]|nr:hypothetical protein [Mycobacterium sp.]